LWTTHRLKTSGFSCEIFYKINEKIAIRIAIEEDFSQDEIDKHECVDAFELFEYYVEKDMIKDLTNS